MRIRHLGFALFTALGACSGQITTLENIGSGGHVDASVPPVLQPQSQLVPYGSTGPIPLQNITEDNLEELNFAVVSPPSNGTIQDAGDSMSFTPNPGFEGVDRVTVVARRGNQTSNPAVISLRTAKPVLPWIECNVPNDPIAAYYPDMEGIPEGMTILEHTLQGLHNWAKVSDTILVSTISSGINTTYQAISAQKPAGLRVIGGMKPIFIPGCAPYNPAIYDFADGPSWQIIARDAQRIVELTGTNIVIIENEVALWPFHFYNQEVDFDKLRISLIPLQQTGVETWWWFPNIFPSRPDNPDLHEESIAFVRAVAETLPNAKFITSYGAWQEGILNQYDQMTNRTEMIELVGLDRIRELLYVTKTGTWFYPGENGQPDYHKPCFSSDQTLEKLEIEPSEPVIVYPGHESWLPVSQEFSQRYFQRP